MSSQNTVKINRVDPSQMIEIPKNFVGINAPYCKFPSTDEEPTEDSNGSMYLKWIRHELGGVAVLFAAGGVALVDRDTIDSILLMRRGDDGEWTIPCGVVCPGSDSRETAMVKARSEVGIRVDLTQEDLLAVYGSWPIFKAYPNGDQAFFEKVIYLAYRSGLKKQGAICDRVDTAEVKWFPLDMDAIPPRHSPEMPEMIELIKKRIELTKFMEGLSASGLTLMDAAKRLELVK